VGESYGSHLTEAAQIAVWLLGGGAACLVHGFLPILFQRRASQTMAVLHEKFKGKVLIQTGDVRLPD
jgi:hypothetical protein